MSLYVLPDGDAIDLNTITHVSVSPGETAAGLVFRPRVTLRTRFALVVLNLATFEEACKVRDEIIKAVNERPLYVIREEEIPISYVASEHQAQEIVERFNVTRADDQSRYTYDEVLPA